MAIFEKTVHGRIVVDDTEDLICVIENAQNINKHTEYQIRVQRGPNKDDKWMISRRYRDFAALHSSLQPANIELPLPPKKLIGNMQPSFIAERQIALQAYIDEVLKHRVLELSLQVRSFLDPNNYSLSIAEQALQTVSIALRGEGSYELKTPLPDIGWRIRKHYFVVTDSETRTNCMLSWQNYGPDRHLCDKDLQAAFKSISNLSHPFIDPILAIRNNETGAYVVRRIHESGTVRDMLYGTEYTKGHLVKYGNPKVRKSFTRGQIVRYGYQMLLALKFLHDKGLPHGHIHPGNIAIENQKVQLLDLENLLMGVPSLHRPHLLALRKSSSMEQVDVQGFARTIYEMAFARTLEDHCWDKEPDYEYRDNLELLLWECLSSSSQKHGTPSIDYLLNHELFSAPLNGITPHPPSERSHLKFPLALKDALRDAIAVTEDRLRSDQKSVRSAKREVRIQEILNSGEELRKHRRRAKKRDGAWKFMSSMSDVAGPSHSASTASSPTPPVTTSETNGHLTPAPVHAPVNAPTPAPSTDSPSNARGALLDAICAFDKSRLSRVNGR